jgi:xanthine/CO dehydrogenase XdhC/CoxF family maturation factor
LSTRRRDTRRESSERIVLSVGSRDVAGWTLNQSQGGIRAVVEEPLELGADLWVAIGAGDRRPGRIVWLQEERDGSIVGIAFLDRDKLES